MFICDRCFHLLEAEAPRCPRCGLARPPGGFDREAYLGQIILGRYELTERIGAGATGSVYLARRVRPADDGTWPPRVAVKLLHSRFGRDRALRLRFRREALAASQIDSPHVARTLAYGETDDGAIFLVMEEAAGEGLDTLLAPNRALSVQSAVAIARDVAVALEAAHRVGIIHRDLKPSNVMITASPAGFPRATVLDFGYARILSPERGAVKLTEAGIVIGTPTYMSPEQTGRETEVDERADLYALGALLYRMLVGRPPFEGETIMDLILMHRDSAPPPFAVAAPARHLPAALEQVVMRLLAKDPSARFKKATDVREALRPFVGLPRETSSPFGPRAPTRRRLLWIALVLAGVAFCAALLWWG